MPESEYCERRYLTDDRDARIRTELVVMHAPNGDYYIGSVEEGDGMTRGVRICTSGGCSYANPKLLKAVQDVFEALGGWRGDEQ